MDKQVGCKKTRFSDESQAEFFIKKLGDTSFRKKKPVRSYLCPDCLSWHLTSRQEKDNLLIEGYQKKIKTYITIITQLNERIRELKEKLRSQKGGRIVCDQSQEKLPTQK